MKTTWFFLLDEHFDQVFNHTSNQEEYFLKMVHQNAYGYSN
jgi:hypothetical protein